MTGSCVMFFVKWPAPGRVKTRLAETIGPKLAKKLYENFVTDTLTMLQRLNVPIIIFFEPPDYGHKFIRWLGSQHRYMPQRGCDLGARMKDAFVRTFDTGFSRAVAIGSDIPDLPADFIRQAFSALDSEKMVIGPSDDGGYYLVGFSADSFVGEVFDNIDWGTNLVFQQTLAIAKSRDCPVHILPRWYDIDTADDLRLLLDRNVDTEFVNSKTFSCVKPLSRSL